MEGSGGVSIIVPRRFQYGRIRRCIYHCTKEVPVWEDQEVYLSLYQGGSSMEGSGGVSITVPMRFQYGRLRGVFIIAFFSSKEDSSGFIKKNQSEI